MRTQTREKLFSLFTSLTLLSQYVIGIFSYLPAPVYADAPTSWPSFTPYLVNGSPVYDDEKIGGHDDPSNGGTAVSPSNVDIASGATFSGSNPGTQASVFVNFDGTDFLFFRTRLAGDPFSPGSSSRHWDVLLDTDKDGFKEFVIDLDHNSDVLGVYSNDLSTNTYNPATDAIWTVTSAETSGYVRSTLEDYGTASDSDNQYYLDFAIPVTAFGAIPLATLKDSNLFFSTSASNTDPLQKDWMGFAGFIFSISKEVSMDGSAWVELEQATAGDGVYFRVTLTNSGNVNMSGISLGDTLPIGFSYVSGSTVGVTTSDPTISGQDLSWSGPFTVPSGESISLVFQTTAPSVVSHTSFTNTVSAYMTASPTVLLGSDTADIEVDPGTGTLRVNKVTNPSSDTTTEFTITATGSGEITGSAERTITGGSFEDYEVTPGTYSVDESYKSGWSIIGDTCEEVAIVAGDTSECTITNGKLPTLTVLKDFIKHDGGNETVENFDLYIDGDLETSLWGTSYILSIGDHNFFEIGPDGYVPSYSEGCENGNVNLGYGDDTTCTITNDDVAPQLTVVKNVINDNGGDNVVGDFNIELNEGGLSFGSGVVVGSTTTYTATPTVLANTSYTLTEDDRTGYAEGSWSCVDDDTQQSISHPVTLNEGQNVTCTITNDDQPGTLIVKKVVVNDNGGNAVGSDFYFQVNGGEPGPFLDDEALKEISVPQGTYTVTEESAEGYEISYDNCEEAFIPNGGSATCTVTNNDIAPSLTLYKSVNNGDGGNAFYLDWTLTATGPTPISGAGGANSDENFSAGTYILSESGPDGYTPSNWLCSNLDNDGTITIGLDEDVVCSITNDDIAPTLKLVKEVTNNNGGNAVSGDWTLSAHNEEEDGLGDGFSDSGDSTVFHPVTAGITYALSESEVSGYSAGEWSCDGGSLEGDELVLGLDEDVTCTITNDDIAPTITLYKEVITNNGGTAGPNDFGLTIGGTPVTSGQVLAVDANTPIALNEVGLFGYQFSFITGEGCPEVLGGTVTLDEGESISCTITNDDIQPKLTVIKHVVNNSTGTKLAGDFTILIAGQSPSPTPFSGDESGTLVALNAGEYSVTEEPVAGYTAFYSEDCVGDIKVGEEKTCTVTNNDQDVLGEEDEGEVLPATGTPLFNLLFAALAFEVGLYLRRRSRRA